MDRGPSKACMVSAAGDSTASTQFARQPPASAQGFSLQRELSFFLAKTLPTRPELCCGWAAAQVTSFSSRELKEVTWAAAHPQQSSGRVGSVFARKKLNSR